MLRYFYSICFVILGFLNHEGIYFLHGEDLRSSEKLSTSANIQELKLSPFQKKLIDNYQLWSQWIVETKSHIQNSANITQYEIKTASVAVEIIQKNFPLWRRVGIKILVTKIAKN